MNDMEPSKLEQWLTTLGNHPLFSFLAFVLIILVASGIYDVAMARATRRRP